MCSALSRLLPARVRPTAAAPSSAEGTAGNGAVFGLAAASATWRSIRSVSSGSSRRDGTWSSSPLMTGHSTPARLGGSGSSFTTAIRVGRGPARS